MHSTTSDKTAKIRTRIQWQRHTNNMTRIMSNVVTNMTITTAVPVATQNITRLQDLIQEKEKREM